jgi:uncharacterized protein YydD (DUF2326 family)
MSDEIPKSIQQYKDFKSLQEFACAQNTTILQLSKKVQTLESKLKHAEDLLKTTVPNISSQLPGVKDFTQDDSEYICTVEIAKLKSFTRERELTLEESRKLDTYYKILNNINSKPKVEKEVEKLPTSELLKLVESKDDNGK